MTGGLSGRGCMRYPVDDDPAWRPPASRLGNPCSRFTGIVGFGVREDSAFIPATGMASTSATARPLPTAWIAGGHARLVGVEAGLGHINPACELILLAIDGDAPFQTEVLCFSC